MPSSVALRSSAAPFARNTPGRTTSHPEPRSAAPTGRRHSTPNDSTYPPPFRRLRHRRAPVGLYWSAADRLIEARYLEAILHSTVLTERVRSLQARGEHNPHDFDKYVRQLPIPMFDTNDPRHVRLATLAEEAEKIA